MNGLNKKGVSNQLSVKLKADIDNYCENAEWFCSVHGANIPREFVAKGCDNWVDITKAE